jgi:hypothetical protein
VAVRKWQLAGGAAVVALAAAVAVFSTRGGRASHKPQPAPHASDPPADASSSSRPHTHPRDQADAAPPAHISPPDLTKVTASCLLEEPGDQLCVDHILVPEEVDEAKSHCRRGPKFTSATWRDTPCDHAASHGGCWSWKQTPTRIRWFYGTLNADFKPGPDTHRVCGMFSVGFLADGTPVKQDGTKFFAH